MGVRGWKQMDLERRSGVSQKTISNILAEKKVPTLDTVDMLANAFGLNLWHMIMPTLIEDLESGSKIEQLYDNYFHSSKRGRDYIQSVAEREAEYEKNGTR